MSLSRSNISLKPYTTFGIEAHASRLAVLEDIAQWKALQDEAMALNLPIKILGGGSNVLLTGDQDAYVILNRLKGIEVLEQTDRHWLVRAAAGENWHQLVMWSMDQGMGGLENLSLIPGCCGAAPMQNIGAYGVEIKDVLERVETIDRATGEVRIFSNAECAFGYRESIFKHEAKDQFIITAIVLKLRRAGTYALKMDYGDIKAMLEQMQVAVPDMKALCEAVMAIRRSKLPDPAEYGNAGSFFKNPEVPTPMYDSLKEKYPLMPGYPGTQAGFTKVPAGWLIEQVGLKGYRSGQAGSFARQALVLVNYGGATGAEVYAVAMHIQEAVFNQFGITILPEVNVW